MDRVTKALLDEFVSQNGLQSLSEETAFEHFTGYLVTSSHYTETFSSDEIHVGAGGDGGMDTISVIVNGNLITEPEEIEDLAETNGYLDVVLIFNQAERSSGFETQKVGQFGFGVQDFLATTPTLPHNEQVKIKWRIVNEVFNRSSLFKKGNPQCYLYYTTTGRWAGDTNLAARRDAVIADIQGLSVFRKVEFDFIDAERIQTLFRATKNAISTEINFPTRNALPELPGIEQAYLGLLSATEYLKLIENSNEEVITSIFYDNVRHWQDWNPVNTEMKETIESSNKIYFPLLNNGVTIIAKRIAPTGNKFVLEDYQVVNGCQTSYVLHETRSHLTAEMLVPVRLIATDNPDIKNAIIKATNRQTEVSEEQLFALSEFPKKLEAYFPTFEGVQKLYYERRSRQYNAEEGIEKVRVITMTILVRAYASFFLGVPHRTTRNYKALLRSIGTDIFHKDDRLEMYYVAAYAHYKLEYLFRSQAIDATLKAARYHLLLIFRIIATKTDALPRSNSHDMKRLCDGVMQVLWDDNAVRTVFQQAAGIINTASSGNLHRDNIRTEPFTEAVKNAALAFVQAQNAALVQATVATTPG